jgi:hypothetical protein
MPLIRRRSHCQARIPVRAETVIRDALRVEALEATDGARDAFEELWVPRTHERADLVIVGRSMHGFEIKTHRDTLHRLPRQAAAYARVFERCTAVVATRHVHDVANAVPEWWGITEVTANGRVAFTARRNARRNPSVDAETLVRLLWRDEALSALVTLGGNPDPESSRARLWEQLLRAATLDRLQAVVRRALLSRDPARARIATRHVRTRLSAAAAGR